MKSHGDYKVELINDIVHIYPVGGFNAEGILDVRGSVLSIAPTDRPWGLFEHPKDLAGLTPEASDELLKSYQEFSEHNCIAVALEICSTWQGVVERKLSDNLDIPFYLSNDLEQLIGSMKQHFGRV